MLLTKSCESAVDLLKNRRDNLSNWLIKSATSNVQDQGIAEKANHSGAYLMGYVAAVNDVLALFGRSDRPKH